MSRILRIALPTPLDRLFDYLAPESAPDCLLQPGQRIEVPFGRGRKVGFLVAVAETSEVPVERLRAAITVLDPEALLRPADLALLTWASRYYHHPLGAAMAAAFTALLRQGGAAPPTRQRRLVAVAATAPELGRAAPRQMELLQRLLASPLGLEAKDLAGPDGDYRPAAAALLRKGLAAWQEAPPSSLAGAPVALPGPCLNPHQAAAVAAILAAPEEFRVFLLDGVTGSGKTEVYLQAVAATLAAGRQAMVLLPEISLTPQLEERFRSRLAAPVVMYHSALADGERRRAWLAMQRGEAAILLGTRSAVFTPMARAGLIVLDEEHDASFKQQDGFRFSARDVAIKRASLGGIPVVLGSATPSLESLHNAGRGRYRRLELPERTGSAGTPRLGIVDIRSQKLVEGISGRLAKAIADTLARGEQALLFVNRRGFAPTLICHACGWVAGCRQCDARLVLHAGEQRLRCHHCGHEHALPPACPECSARDLWPQGLGTERVEAALAELFPEFRLARIDRDNIRGKLALERRLADIREGRVDLLIGTQMLAKGHHFPQVTLVGIIDVDAGLYSTDFRAAERTAQLIMQVAGRAGREERPGRVLLQTRHPEHPLLQALVREGYGAFARSALAERAAAGLPPYSHQALWRADASRPEPPERFLRSLAERARDLAVPELRVFGPAPAPLARRAGRHRWQLLLQSPARASLHTTLERLRAELSTLDEAKKVRWSIDVDPVDLF